MCPLSVPRLLIRTIRESVARCTSLIDCLDRVCLLLATCQKCLTTDGTNPPTISDRRWPASQALVARQKVAQRRSRLMGRGMEILCLIGTGCCKCFCQSCLYLLAWSSNTLFDVRRHNEYCRKHPGGCWLTGLLVSGVLWMQVDNECPSLCK